MHTGETKQRILQLAPSTNSYGDAACEALLEPAIWRYCYFMTDKQAVVDALQRLPENASIEEIMEELQIMTSVRRARADVANGRTKTHQEAKQLLESWAAAPPSR